MVWDAIALLARASPTSQSSSTAASSTASSSSTGTSTSSAAGETHTCSVGADGFTYTPHEIYADIGDVIEFLFYPQNHSVARAGFKEPCIPYEDTGAYTGFWSGFKPVAIVEPDPPTFRLLINDTEPVFFYCSAPDACQRGMVGVINPNSTFNYSIQEAYALNSTASFSPGQYFPSEAFPSTSTTITSATSTPTASSKPATIGSSSHSSLSGGAIAGIAIGGFVVVLLAAVLLYMCGRQKSLAEILRYSRQHPSHNGNAPYANGLPGGMAEANYPNTHKVGHVSVASGPYSDQGYASPRTDTGSYRSSSPPIDERTGMMSVLHANGQHAMHLRNGLPSPPIGGMPPSPGYTAYANGPMNEMDRSGDGLIPTQNDHQNTGPHELSGTTTSPDLQRPFSFADSETGYRPSDQKIDPMLK